MLTFLCRGFQTRIWVIFMLFSMGYILPFAYVLKSTVFIFHTSWLSENKPICGWVNKIWPCTNIHSLQCSNDVGVIKYDLKQMLSSLSRASDDVLLCLSCNQCYIHTDKEQKCPFSKFIYILCILRSLDICSLYWIMLNSCQA